MRETRFRLAVFVMAVAGALSLNSCGDSSKAPTTGNAEANGPYQLAVATDPKFDADTTMEKLSKAKKITIGTKFDQPLFGLKGPDGKPRALMSQSARSSPHGWEFLTKKLSGSKQSRSIANPFFNRAGWTSSWQPTPSTMNGRRSSTLRGLTTRRASRSWF